MPQGTMELWCPWAAVDDRGGSGPQALDNPIIVLHTTETRNPAYYNNTEPTFEVSLGAGVIQFAALDRAAKALWNEPGGVETNRRPGGVIQIEIVWYAADAENMPDELLAILGRLLAWIAGQLGIDLVPCPQGFHGQGEGIVLASEFSPIRFGNAYPASEWNEPGSSSGVPWTVCAHQHVGDRNDHWDTGLLPWARLVPFFGLPTQEDPDMAFGDADHFALTFLAALMNDGKTLFLSHLGDGDWGLGLVRLAEVCRVILGLPVDPEGVDPAARLEQLREAAAAGQRLSDTFAPILAKMLGPGVANLDDLERTEPAQCP